MRRRAAILSLAIAASCAAPESPAPLALTRSDIRLVPDTFFVQGVVPRDATLQTMLRGHGVAVDAVEHLVAVARTVFDPRRLRSLQPFTLERTLEGAVRLFEYEIDTDSFLRVTPTAATPAALHAEVLPIPKTREEAVVSGRIDQQSPSLFQAFEAAGHSVELAIILADIFAGEIDFNTELQPEDHFTIAFERYRRDGRPDTYGAITAAEFYNDGRLMKAIRFAVDGEKPAYYDVQGRSLRRFFLRSPLKFEPRVTSGFSLSRMHPVLHTSRAHRGVDYGAPTGAPVVAIASGAVVSATFDGTNGRMVRLRHASGYESYYLHLSAFAAGVRSGAHISQGETIGLVGSTGLATGPHLHYGLTKSGAFVNPLREQRNMPPGEPIPARAMRAFEEARDRALSQLSGPPTVGQSRERTGI